MTTYLSHNTAPVVKLEDGIEKWKVNGVEVSEALLEYRKLSIEKGERNMLDTYQEELSVNGILLFDDLSSVYPDSSLEYGLHLKKREAIVNKFAKAGKKKYNECSGIAKELSDDEDENNSQIREPVITMHNQVLFSKIIKESRLREVASLSRN
ncbi:hypothetical protein BDB00DRAFT_790822 [Zychaea mexicana]|uniref:uncharacterized protein n=1 Tax=Zychaea mexicana TaxID=64656 RepID=UPI0022FF33E1|nr:uncharacterized protein BDB00DRAFT_790822 [Zychaea mexicana]KAI9489760.1 hypothetical protein BDB00DRAFT_790822 [Zychaea mexicana]